MNLEYEVHSVSDDEATIVANVGGKDREVRADVLSVELTRPGSALTFRFDEVEDARKLFKVGKTVTLTFAGAK